jgi:hyperosmotically inducible protein
MSTLISGARRALGGAACLTLALSVISAGAQTPPTKAPTTREDQRRVAQAANAVKDSWITFKIHVQFLPEDPLEGSNVDVDTAKGVVTLTGTVPNAAARTRAVAIAKATDGVVSVTDKLTIGPAERAIDMKRIREAGRSTGRTITDGWVKSKIYAQYLTENTLDDSHIDIDITNGAVTLNGTVKSEAGRARALAIAKATDGVTSVKDALKIGG